MARSSQVSSASTTSVRQQTLTRYKPSKYYDPTRVGTLLIILNRACMGGEIVIGCGDKEVLFAPASAKREHFYIAR